MQKDFRQKPVLTYSIVFSVLMIVQADAMLYEAKEGGKNQFKGCAFDRGFVPSQEATVHYKSHHEVRA